MEEEITGTLKFWNAYEVSEDEFIIEGYLYDDAKGRWPDNTLITTSGISIEDYPAEALKEGTVVKTRNSAYKLGKEGE